MIKALTINTRPRICRRPKRSATTFKGVPPHGRSTCIGFKNDARRASPRPKPLTEPPRRVASKFWERCARPHGSSVCSSVPPERGYCPFRALGKAQLALSSNDRRKHGVCKPSEPMNGGIPEFADIPGQAGITKSTNELFRRDEHNGERPRCRRRHLSLVLVQHKPATVVDRLQGTKHPADRFVDVGLVAKAGFALDQQGVGDRRFQVARPDREVDASVSASLPRAIVGAPLALMAS
jgi:hypothetical protein